MSEEEFIAEVFEIAFGDDAVNRDYTFDEVLLELREFSDTALQLEHETDFPPDAQSGMDTRMNQAKDLYEYFILFSTSVI